MTHSPTRIYTKFSKEAIKNHMANNLEHQFLFKFIDNRPWWMPYWLLNKLINAVYSKEAGTKMEKIKIVTKSSVKV